MMKSRNEEKINRKIQEREKRKKLKYQTEIKKDAAEVLNKRPR